MGYKYAVPIPLKLTRAESDVNKVTTYRKEYGRRTNAHYATSTPTLRTLKAPLGLPADLWGAAAGRSGPRPDAEPAGLPRCLRAAGPRRRPGRHGQHLRRGLAGVAAEEDAGGLRPER